MTSAHPGVWARTVDRSMPAGRVVPTLITCQADGTLGRDGAAAQTAHRHGRGADASSLDFDGGGLLGFGPGLGYVYRQHAILGFGADRGRIRAFWQREGAGEAAVEVLDLVELLILLLLLLPPLTAHLEHAVFDRHIDVFLLHSRQGGADQVLLVGLTDVD